MEFTGLSDRGAANVAAIWPRISNAVSERERTSAAPSDLIDMNSSENWVLRDELMDLYKQAVNADLRAAHLSYPNGLAGDSELLESLSDFFNYHFEPHVQVEPDHVVTAPGAAFALDALLHNICDVGDGILIPAPCWNGFDWLLGVRAGVNPIFAPITQLEDSFTLKVVAALEKSFQDATCPVKGVLLTNPNNPLGQCYPREVIEGVICFCDERKIHFISDEIYAMSLFHNPDVSDPVPFLPLMQIDVQALGCDPSRVHTIWSISKDFGSSGLRMGCAVTQYNKPLRTGIALVSNTQLSSLTAIVTTSLLRSPDLPKLLKLNADRLSQAYAKVMSFLKERNLCYIPANMGPFLFAQMVPGVKDWSEEAKFVEDCKKLGVLVSAGRSYHVPEDTQGWVRLNFALPPERLEKGLERLARVFQ
ncbi:PLP-dependent transferase [Xylariaceae sp. FL0255]|nr:PLP-dependent transferase [Xylariaceae sp. FL0255]